MRRIRLRIIQIFRHVRLNLLNIAVILSGIIPGRLYIFKMLVKDCNADDRKAGNCGYRCDCNSDSLFCPFGHNSPPLCITTW